jgi:hypothetical protein
VLFFIVIVALFLDDFIKPPILPSFLAVVWFSINIWHFLHIYLYKLVRHLTAYSTGWLR